LAVIELLDARLAPIDQELTPITPADRDVAARHDPRRR
jgi:hypothetical protein